MVMFYRDKGGGGGISLRFQDKDRDRNRKPWETGQCKEEYENLEECGSEVEQDKNWEGRWG